MPSSTFIPRILEDSLQRSLKTNPVTALLGPRQSGKSTLVKQLLGDRDGTLYLDLERPSDLSRLDDAEWFLSTQSDKLICLDEIQRKPDLFPLIRSLVDEQRRPGMFLILGSASRELIRQSSESLAGRIRFLSLTPLLWQEVSGRVGLETYLARGGFPPSLLASDDQVSYDWRQDFISTFLERDLLQFSGFPPVTMRRLWQMLAHSNGQTLNLSSLGNSLGISHTAIRKYLDLLEGTFMIRQLRPYTGNTKKRLIKSPKVYLSDTGIATALLNLKNFEHAAGHPSFGALWETAVFANLYGHFPKLDYSFYRTSNGNEIDLVVSNGVDRIAIECKASVSPRLTKGNYSALEEIAPIRSFIAAPVATSYRSGPDIEVLSLADLPQGVGEALGI